MLLEVTEMILGRPPVPPVPRSAWTGWQVAERRMTPADFLGLYRAVGESVQWDDRLRMPAETLARHLAASSTRIFLLEADRSVRGLCEFEDCAPSGARLAHFGVVPDLRGTGLGRMLLHAALSAVWRPGAPIRLDTDTNDDPRALGVYRDAGFTVEAMAWRFFPD